ncbi:hypothetical protein PPO43_00765 [Saprospira sp. CCB-QB6]|uniref:hypothetical protein n=1 Tax=Saprospira sp. CCB-QB6 TaxID=3023936 RepID=UPI00234A5A6D|nr:hypothetical protein [Saprospira sp. CCB-QB6]WCL81627.1 hypothetical protein PPO43_00765 [Saprospira sp. CCB-QB6]
MRGYWLFVVFVCSLACQSRQPDEKASEKAFAYRSISEENLIIYMVEEVNNISIAAILDSIEIESGISEVEADSRFLRAFDLANMGAVELYELNVKQERRPRIAPTKYYCLRSKRLNKLFYIPLEKYFLLKLNTSSDTYVFSGIDQGGKRAHYTILGFDAISGTLKLKWSSLRHCSIPVFIRTPDSYCQRYLNDSLAFKNEDVNGDGYLDVVFEGLRKSSCMDENGEEKEIKFSILMKPDLENLEWILSDESICDMDWNMN